MQPTQQHRPSAPRPCSTRSAPRSRKHSCSVVRRRHLAWVKTTWDANRWMPSWQCQEERRQWQRSHRHLQTSQIDGGRHRLGVAAHLAGNVGEALRPGPPHSDYADELTECLQMLDEGMNVVWDPGMNARLARIWLAEHAAIPARSGPIGTDEGRDLPGTGMTICPSGPNTDDVGYDSSRGRGSHKNLGTGLAQESVAAAASTSTAAENFAAENYAKNHVLEYAVTLSLLRFRQPTKPLPRFGIPTTTTSRRPRPRPRLRPRPTTARTTTATRLRPPSPRRPPRPRPRSRPEKIITILNSILALRTGKTTTTSPLTTRPPTAYGLTTGPRANQRGSLTPSRRPSPSHHAKTLLKKPYGSLPPS